MVLAAAFLKRALSIENAFARLKALMRVAAGRTKAALWNAVGSIIELFTLA